MTDARPDCAHCGRPTRGFASMDEAWLCHPDDGLDCYRLVTVYHHTTPCGLCLIYVANAIVLRETASQLRELNPDWELPAIFVEARAALCEWEAMEVAGGLDVNRRPPA